MLIAERNFIHNPLRTPEAQHVSICLVDQVPSQPAFDEGTAMSQNNGRLPWVDDHTIGCKRIQHLTETIDRIIQFLCGLHYLPEM